jgi:hypothetical protein
MGSSFSPDGGPRGVIPCVMDTIFERIEAAPDASFTVRVGFVEVLLVRAPRAATPAERPRAFLPARRLCWHAQTATCL